MEDPKIDLCDRLSPLLVEIARIAALDAGQADRRPRLKTSWHAPWSRPTHEITLAVATAGERLVKSRLIGVSSPSTGPAYALRVYACRQLAPFGPNRVDRSDRSWMMRGCRERHRALLRTESDLSAGERFSTLPAHQGNRIVSKPALPPHLPIAAARANE
jgi:hypothetical protein